ncbi:MAG: hypothetical protein RLZZ244_542 [Verrucomicrobiota bacterium]|jgi:hypothetical protein
MTRQFFAPFFAISLFTALASQAKAPTAPKLPESPVYLTEDEAAAAGPDYKLQGEYAGATMGANVVALGDGEFRLVLFPGGLPGAGWDGTPKIEVEGRREGDGVLFRNSAEFATLSEGALKIKGTGLVLNRLIRHSPTEGLGAPKGAIILFDGKSTDAWVRGKIDPRGCLNANTKTKEAFTDVKLHVEFFLPFKPLSRGQDRANSGLYLQHRYEVQVLDSFGLEGLDNECGGIYKHAAPKVNMCFPPLQWQTYDIEFTAAKFDSEGKKTSNAVVSVRHNGVLVHDALELKSVTPAGAFQTEVPIPGPLFLQSHGNFVVYRNIWVVPN